MLHVLSSLYDPDFDQIGRSIQEIAVCCGMLRNEWKEDLRKNLKQCGFDAVWHDVSLSNYRSIEASLQKGDTVWILIDGIETDGYPGSTVISYIEELQGKYDLHIIGPRLAFYSQNKLDQKNLLMEKRVNIPAYFYPEDRNAAASCFSFLFQNKPASYIIKPYDLYCSVGIESDSAVDNEQDAMRVYDRLLKKTSHIIIEQFIRGREFTIVCIGNENGIIAYPPAERVFNSAHKGMGFMDFSMTQILHGDHSVIEMKPVSDPDLVLKIQEMSRTAFSAVDAGSYVRIDLRLDTQNGLLYILEVNPCPSIGMESSIEEILTLNNISFETFFKDLLHNGITTAPAEARIEDQKFAGSDKVVLSRDPIKGRYLLAKKDIRKGETIYSTSIDAYGVMEVNKQNYCHRCLKFSEQPFILPCKSCGQVYYCSEECREHDMMHKKECATLLKFCDNPSDHIDALTYYRTNIQVLTRLLDGTKDPITLLVSNYDKTNTVKRIEVWKIAFKLEELFDNNISLSNILATVCATDCNCFSAEYVIDGITLLSAKFAMLEHSCTPNANRKVDGKTVTVYALKDIPANSPVAISYISNLYHRDVRLQNLEEYFYFQCACPLCLSGKDELHPDDLAVFREIHGTEKPGNLKISSVYSFLSGRIVEHKAGDISKYPSYVKENHCGKGLYASEDLSENCCVEIFEGEIMPYSQVPEEEKAYALLLGKDEWLVYATNARYANHSCEPNCRIGENREIKTIRPVKKDEELTISYNRVSRTEYEESPEHFFWDPIWTFSCKCGSPHCAGRIDNYVIID